MPKTVTLLRPFVFSSPPKDEHHKLPREQWFKPQKDAATGDWVPTPVELPDDVANHPFIAEHYADGCIERPEITAERVAALQAKRQQEDEVNARELRKAEEALKRASGTHEVHKAIDEDVERQLNTPVNQLNAQQGQGIGKKAGK